MSLGVLFSGKEQLLQRKLIKKHIVNSSSVQHQEPALRKVSRVDFIFYVDFMGTILKF